MTIVDKSLLLIFFGSVHHMLMISLTNNIT